MRLERAGGAGGELPAGAVSRWRLGLQSMKASGELQSYCKLKAQAAKGYAETLMKCGTWEQEAWRLAIRQEILEREAD